MLKYSYFIAYYELHRLIRYSWMYASAQKQVLPLKHNQVWSKTTRGWFHYKHCKAKSGFFTMLAKFFHCEFITNVQQLFRALPSNLDMFCSLDFVLRHRLSPLLTKKNFFFLSFCNMAIHISVRTCDAYVADHECGKKPQAFSLHFCILQAIKNWRGKAWEWSYLHPSTHSCTHAYTCDIVLIFE